MLSYRDAVVSCFYKTQVFLTYMRTRFLQFDFYASIGTSRHDDSTNYFCEPPIGLKRVLMSVPL